MSQKKCSLVNVEFLPSSTHAQAQLETKLALISFDLAANPPLPTHESLFGSLYKPDLTKPQS